MNDDDLRKARLATRLILLAFGLGISSWAPMVPFAKNRIGLDDAELGLSLLFFGIGALATMPLTGILIKRFGTRLLTLCSGINTVILLPFLALVDTSWGLVTLLFLFGAATGALNVSINAQAVEVELASKKAIMSGFHCFFSSGGLAGASIVGLLIGQQFALHNAVAIVATVMALLIATQWRYLMPHREDTTDSKNIDAAWSMPENKVLWLGLLCFMAFLTEGSMLDWSAELLHSTLEYNVEAAGIGYALFSIAMALGRLVGDRFIARYGVVAVFQAGSLLAASGILLVVSLDWRYYELVGFCLIGLGAANIVPIIFSACGRTAYTAPSTALTIVTTMGYIGLLSGPALIGLAANAITLSLAFASIALCMLFICISKQAIAPKPSLQPDHV